MTPQEFVAKWKKADLSERSACQQHFLDLCEMLGQSKPADIDPTGEFFTFEYGVEKTDGGRGFADVWKKDFFGWEYKGKHKNLAAAYQQLLKYREALQNPPLLVVCDLDRFEVHTNFTGTVKKKHEFSLAELADAANLRILRCVFTDPGALKPGDTPAAVTEEVAGRFAKLADGMSARGIPPQQAAHFLMKLMFCMFAEDIELLPRELFTRTVANAKDKPAQLSRLLKNLFESMAKGEPFGADPIAWFNGGLFADSDTIDLTPDEIAELLKAARCDWSSVEPTIFGTLFERSLDPTKRSQIGAHYTSREDIETLLKPVLLAPLRREWEETRDRAEKLWEKVQAEGRPPSSIRKSRTDSKARREFDKCLLDFADRLTRVTVLDPACGSGNFLYVAIHLLLDLEKEVLTYAAEHGLAQLAWVSPRQLRGLEINQYAFQLAQVVLWIGFLQWMHFNGIQPKLDPVLDKFENIANTDAILDLTDPANPREPEWPEADFIVGNPPFLGDKKLRGELGDNYVENVREVYAGRIPGQSDLCCYWFERARKEIELGRAGRAGLLATQAIRGGGNRTVLDRILASGDLFWAHSDRDWVLDGANVHVSMVGFGPKAAPVSKQLDSKPVARINADLTGGADVSSARELVSNQNRSFLGSCKGGAFDIDESEALGVIRFGGNPNGRPNSDVVRPVQNSDDILQRRKLRWIIDTANLTLDEACLYEKPQAIIVERVKPHRDANRDSWLRTNWWRAQRMRPNMRLAVSALDRFLVTTTTSKHRIFVWLQPETLPDHQLVVFATADDYDFAVLHSRLHELWARSQGTQVRERESGFRYTPTTCFETFPFPGPQCGPTHRHRYSGEESGHAP